MFIKKKLRTLSIWFYRITREWVVNPEFYSTLRNHKTEPLEEELQAAALYIAAAHVLWKEDPELVRARSLLRFIEIRRNKTTIEES